MHFLENDRKYVGTDFGKQPPCQLRYIFEFFKDLNLKSNLFGFEPEFTAKVAKKGLRIYETPISYSGRTYSEGKKITWKDGIVAIFTILWFHFFD